MLRDAGRGADAERWARRGLAEDPASYWADGLREQLAGLLLASGRGEEAVSVRRAQFERRGLHQDYSRLRDTAERAGQWPGLREWALEYLRDRAQVKRLAPPQVAGAQHRSVQRLQFFLPESRWDPGRVNARRLELLPCATAAPTPP